MDSVHVLCIKPQMSSGFFPLELLPLVKSSSSLASCCGHHFKGHWIAHHCAMSVHFLPPKKTMCLSSLPLTIQFWGPLWMHIQQKPNCYSIQRNNFKKQLFWNSVPHLQITISLPTNLLHSQIAPQWSGSRQSVAFPGKEAHLWCPRPAFKRRFQSKNCFHSFSISQSCPRCSQELSCSESR